MNSTLAFWAAQLGLVFCVLIGALVGWWLVRRIKATAKREDDHQRERLGDSLGFVGGALGIILGLLLVFSAQHYSDAQEASRQEATRVTGLFNSAGLWGEQQRSDLRRDLICAARGIESTDWGAESTPGDGLDLTGDETTTAWLSRVRADVRDLDQSTEARVNYYFYIVDDAIGLDKARQLRLLLRPEVIPGVVWAVIYSSVFLFIALLVLQIGAIRRITYISVIASWLMLAVIVGALESMDLPFTGRVGTVSPIPMQATLAQLQSTFPNEDWSPCPTSPAAALEPGPDPTPSASPST